MSRTSWRDCGARSIGPTEPGSAPVAEGTWHRHRHQRCETRVKRPGLGLGRLGDQPRRQQRADQSGSPAETPLVGKFQFLFR